jgi:hypothetical protein
MAGLQELGTKLFTEKDRTFCEGIEKKLADLEKDLARHADQEGFKRKIWDLMHDESDKLSTEDRIEQCKAWQAKIDDIPKWKTHTDDLYQKAIVGLRPYASKLLHALAEKIEEEIAEISKNGVGGRYDFWKIGAADPNRVLYPLFRLADFTASHIRMIENYQPASGWLLRATLIDAKVIKQKASLIRG